MTPPSDTTIAEEPWEAGIGDLLGALPDVEPPSGFIDQALDHRPARAGRTLAVLAAISVGLVGLAGVTGAADQSVVPPVDDLTTRHDSVVQAGVLGGALDGSSVESPVALPDGFEPAGRITAADIQQKVFERGGESVSVFVQEGRVQWSALPASGLDEVGDYQVWIDPDGLAVVLEASGQTVTIVGLPIDEVEGLLQDLPQDGGDAGPGPARRLVEAIVSPFGYATGG